MDCRLPVDGKRVIKMASASLKNGGDVDVNENTLTQALMMSMSSLTPRVPLLVVHPGVHLSVPVDMPICPFRCPRGHGAR